MSLSPKAAFSKGNEFNCPLVKGFNFPPMLDVFLSFEYFLEKDSQLEPFKYES